MEAVESSSAKLMWPYDTKLPLSINKLLNCVPSTRPPPRLGFDAGIYEPTASVASLKISLDVKSTRDSIYVQKRVSDALKRLELHAKGNSIVLNKTVEHLTYFDLKEFRVINRTRISGDLSVTASREIELHPLDDKNPNILIFLISLDDISSPFN